MAYEDKISWESADILKCVHKMKEPYKEVFYLKLAADLSFAQIGEIMGKSENWARITFFLFYYGTGWLTDAVMTKML